MTAHADHLGWLGDETGSGAPTFPNADYWLTEGEWRFWARPENVGDAIGPRQHELDIIASRRNDLVAGSEPLDGVFAVPTSGHTPGHVAFSVEGTAGRALIVGDAMHCPAEIGHPDLVWVGDHDPRRAVSTRIDIAERARGDGVTLVAPHFPNSVFRREHPSISQVTSSRRALM
ncbi:MULTISPECIES: MBL fold metallo-hydrolase [unclassified Microbacterium]|uniref:MBL fold metallo-hydrolase n=1 Tax=unclassified Microbacterium TaxID=2609290 RepID=UPI0037455AC2